MFRFHTKCVRFFVSTSYRNVSNICIVGSGPAGFYTAQQLIKVIPEVQVDVYESLPVPFGLVRYGVAPDHPEVKNVINTFTKIAHNPAVRFVGNVSIGRDVTLEELRKAYHAVVLTYGAMKDQELRIPGEDLENVIPARRFVGWYNGLPWDKDLKVNLDVKTVAILGQGNVGLDIARILLTPVDILKTTDITEHALAALAESKVKEVLLVGRRGPLQVAFTIKEFREMLSIPECQTILNKDDFIGIEEIIPTLPRPRKRLTELLWKTVSAKSSLSQVYEKCFRPVFLRSPKQIIPQMKNPKVVGGIELIVNKLEGPDLTAQRAVATDQTESIDCGMIVRSIGYRSVQADPAIPFDDSKGHVKNSKGVIEPGLYSAGWVATGPVGVIVSTMTNAFTIAETIAADFRNMKADINKLGFELVSRLLKERGVQTVSFADWEKIDCVEKERGSKLGKPREKILSIAEMLAIASTGS